MAVANMVKRNAYGNKKEILIAPELAFSIGCIVGNSGVTAVNGRKIIKAGTPVGGAVSVLVNRQTVLNKVNDNTAQGIVLHDVDVTEGDANATLVLKGAVDLYKLESDVVTLITSDVKTKLEDITFMNGNK